MCKFYAELKENGAVVRCNSFDNEYFSFNYEKKDDSIKGVLTAKKGFEMQSLVVEYDKDFDDDDLFYANGYQAWTTSREFSKNDKFDGLIEIAKISKFTAHFVGLSGDYHFEKYGDTKSLGVGTFSVEQKNAILEALEVKRKQRPEFEPLFSDNREERFFVKNLETIQGDERDVSSTKHC